MRSRRTRKARTTRIRIRKLRNKRTARAAHYGFTLIELAIVLVILGLLVGGILIGRDLIRDSELKAVIREYNSYSSAVNAFHDKYNGLPGDITNATSFWGAAHATPATCYTTVGTGTQTCNGDGNNLVDGISNADVHEIFRFWQQLANAGLIEGQYTGVNAASGCWITTNAGKNVPASHFQNGMWALREPMGNYSAWFNGNKVHWFQFGAATAHCDNYTPIFRPAELENIDLKLDDGKPATGKVSVRNDVSLAQCTDSNDPTNMNAKYSLASSVVGCTAIFNNAF